MIVYCTVLPLSSVALLSQVLTCCTSCPAVVGFDRERSRGDRCSSSIPQEVHLGQEAGAERVKRRRIGQRSCSRERSPFRLDGQHHLHRGRVRGSAAQPGPGSPPVRDPRRSLRRSETRALGAWSQEKDQGVPW